MTANRSNTTTETGIAFFSAGGHSHDGVNSSIIDTTKYSIFDFNFGQISTNTARIKNQNKNERAFRDFIVKTVNQTVLEPAGVVLQDNIINSRNIIAGSITADLIAANTITANNIAAGTITGDLIAAGAITADLIAANALVASSVEIGASDYWYSNTAFRLGGANGISKSASSNSITIGSSVAITGSTFTGAIYTGIGLIGGWTIDSTSISASSTALYSNGTIICSTLQSKPSITGSIRMGINVGSGEEIHFYAANSSTFRNTLRTDASSNLFVISTIAGRAFFFGTDMTTAGNISVNGVSANTFNGTAIDVSGSAGRFKANGGGSMVKILGSGDGIQARNGADTAFTAMRATAFNVDSSIEDKHDVEPFPSSIDDILSIPVYKWKYNDDETDQVHVFPVIEDLPEDVLNHDSTGEAMVDLRDTIGFLWRGIQELSNKIDDRITLLEQRIEEIE